MSIPHAISKLALVAAGIGIITACGGDKDEETDGTETPATTGDADAETADTSVDSVTEFIPDFFSVNGEFGVDEATGQAVGVETQDAYGSPISLDVAAIVWFATESALNNGFTETNSCAILVEHPGPLDPAPWMKGLQKGERLWTAYEMPADSTVTSFCQNVTDPDWAAFEASFLANNTVAFGVHELDDDQSDDLEDFFTSDWDDLEPNVFGGGYYVPGAAASIAELSTDYVSLGGYAFAYEVDDEFAIQFDETGYALPIDASLVPIPGGVATAFYSQDSYIYLGMGFLN